MAVKSGKSLTITFGSSPTTIEDVTDWTLDQSNKAQEYASSSTAGQTSRVAGVGDQTGSFTVLADALPSGLTIGSAVTLALSSDGTVKPFNAAAMILDVTYSVDVHNLIKATVKWGQKPA